MGKQGGLMVNKKLTIGSLKSNKPKVTINEETSEEFIEKELKKVELDDHIIVKQGSLQFDIKAIPNQTLLETALEQNFDLDYKCRKGTCGKCRVQVLSGEKQLDSINEVEKKKLEFETEHNIRLACQAVIK